MRARCACQGLRESTERPSAQARLRAHVLDDGIACLPGSRPTARRGGAPFGVTPSTAVKVNAVPTQSFWLTPRSPPVASVSRRLITNPSPVPPYARVVELSTWMDRLFQPFI